MDVKHIHLPTARVIHDGQPEMPFWGWPTSTIDWCEENYKITPYIAEFVNTVTNAFFISLALYGVRNSIRQKYHPWFIATEMGFLLVGVGSWLFHATLLYQFQLLDELPMIWTTCIMVAMVWSWDMSKTVAYSVYAALMFTAIAVTAIYMHIKDPTFHQVAYAALTALVLTRSIYLLHTRVEDAKARQNMWWTIMIGVGTFATGFLLWIIDNECCDFLRSVRHQIGIPWAFLLELHGWWHILTGLGVYYYIQFLLYLRLFLEGTGEEFNFVWAYGFLPSVEGKGIKYQNGSIMNGVKHSNGLKKD